MRRRGSRRSSAERICDVPAGRRGDRFARQPVRRRRIQQSRDPFRQPARSVRRPDPDSDCNAHRVGRRDSERNTNLNRERHSYSDANANSNRDADCVRHRNPNCDLVGDRIGDKFANSYANADRIFDGYFGGDTDGYFDRDADSNFDRDADADADGNADLDPDRVGYSIGNQLAKSNGDADFVRHGHCDRHRNC